MKVSQKKFFVLGFSAALLALVPTALVLAVGSGSGSDPVAMPAAPAVTQTEVKTEVKTETKVETPVIKPELKAELKTETKVEVKTGTCKEAELKCPDWSQCQEDGKQRRTCTVSKACTADPKPKLAQEQACPGLKCGQLINQKERIACRLRLSADEMKTELSILYFPEYCRVEETAEDKKECIALYQSFRPCWQMPIGDGRQECARKAIGLGVLVEEKNKCLALKGQAGFAGCVDDLKEKVEHHILFNLYELEFEAEAALKAGKTSVEAVAEFDAKVEAHKAALEKSASIQDWKRIIVAAKADWIAFKSNF